MGKTKLFIVDDNPVIRQGLRSLLESEEQLEVIKADLMSRRSNERLALQVCL